MSDTYIAIEPIPGNPGYVAAVSGKLADPETDPTGTGRTREIAARDIAEWLLEDAHPCAMLAVAAYLREHVDHVRAEHPDVGGERPFLSGILRAAELVEGLA